MKSLSEQSVKLVDGGHFDASSISKKAAELESRFVVASNITSVLCFIALKHMYVIQY